MRASGILMPVFSLPGPYGIGTLGAKPSPLSISLQLQSRPTGRSYPSAPQATGTAPTRASLPLQATPTSLITGCWQQMVC